MRLQAHLTVRKRAPREARAASVTRSPMNSRPVQTFLRIVAMIKSLISLSNRPRKPITRKGLLKVLGYQMVMLVAMLVALVTWRGAIARDPALWMALLTFMCLGVAMLLWLEAWEHRLGEQDVVSTLAEK